MQPLFGEKQSKKEPMGESPFKRVNPFLRRVVGENKQHSVAYRSVANTDWELFHPQAKCLPRVDFLY